VARYYLTDSRQNRPVSSEITGYAVSVLVYLASLAGTSQTAYMAAALRAARFLTHQGWDAGSSTFPFEPGSNRAYFFDIGIIVRGLLAAWRVTQEEEFRIRAREGALSLAFDFWGQGSSHPVISLPDKQPLPYEARWSRSPGCYQLKAALAWREAEEDGCKPYEMMLAYSLATHENFLGAESDLEKMMDRLHAYCYFLEGLLPVAGREEVRQALREGVSRVGKLFREAAPLFERSDVAAQLLRVRLIAHHLGALPLDEAAAAEEAARAQSFQASPDERDPRVRGGFFFGKKRGKILPFSNPASTAFCLQALELWRQHRAGHWCFDLKQLI
jgi:hypothetical protein